MTQKSYSVLFSLITGLLIVILFVIFITKYNPIISDFFNLLDNKNISLLNKCYSKTLESDRINNYISANEFSRNFDYLDLDNIPIKLDFYVDSKDLEKMVRLCDYVYDYLQKKEPSFNKEFTLFQFYVNRDIAITNNNLNIKESTNLNHLNCLLRNVRINSEIKLDNKFLEYLQNKRLIPYDSFDNNKEITSYFIYSHID